MKELTEEEKKYYIALGMREDAIDEVRDFIMNSKEGGIILIEKTADGVDFHFDYEEKDIKEDSIDSIK